MFKRLEIILKLSDSDVGEADRTKEMSFDFTDMSDAESRVLLHSTFFNACTSCIDLCTPEANARLRGFLGPREG